MSITCVVRVYRMTKEDHTSMVGIVDPGGHGQRLAFHDKDELWTILAELYKAEEVNEQQEK